MSFLRRLALPALLLAVTHGPADAQVGGTAPAFVASVRSAPETMAAADRLWVAERDRRLDPAMGSETLARDIQLRAPRRQTMVAGLGFGAALGVGAFLLTSGGCYENEQDPCAVEPVYFVVGGAAIGAIVGAILGE